MAHRDECVFGISFELGLTGLTRLQPTDSCREKKKERREEEKLPLPSPFFFKNHFFISRVKSGQKKEKKGEHERSRQ